MTTKKRRRASPLSAQGQAIAKAMREMAAGEQVRQADIMRATGMSRAVVSEIMNALRTLTVEQLAAICRAIGVSVSALAEKADGYVADFVADPPFEPPATLTPAARAGVLDAVASRDEDQTGGSEKHRRHG